MATHHGGTGQRLEETPAPQEHGYDVPPGYHPEDMDSFDNVEHEHHTTLIP